MSKTNHKFAVKPDWRTPAPAPTVAESGDQAEVRASFERYRKGGDYRLSKCAAEDIETALDCLRRMTGMTWIQVLQTATKNRADKTGLHRTPYADAALNVPRPAGVSPDHTICGIRAGGEFRIFGFRMATAFHVMWFDPEHGVCDG